MIVVKLYDKRGKTVHNGVITKDFDENYKFLERLGARLGATEIRIQTIKN